MSMTESKLWRTRIIPNIKQGFRIETSTKLGVPDCFVILKGGTPCFLELKVKKRDQPGQETFRKDYGPHITCVRLLYKEHLSGPEIEVLFNSKDHVGGFKDDNVASALERLEHYLTGGQ